MSYLPAEANQVDVANPLTRERLQLLDPGRLTRLRLAARAADAKSFAALIGEIATVDPAMARALQGLAERYDYERLEELLQTSPGPSS